MYHPPSSSSPAKLKLTLPYAHSLLLCKATSSCSTHTLGTCRWCCKGFASYSICHMSRWTSDRWSSILLLQSAGTPQPQKTNTNSAIFSNNPQDSPSGAFRVCNGSEWDDFSHPLRLSKPLRWYPWTLPQEAPSFLQCQTGRGGYSEIEEIYSFLPDMAQDTSIWWIEDSGFRGRGNWWGWGGQIWRCSLQPWRSWREGHKRRRLQRHFPTSTPWQDDKNLYNSWHQSQNADAKKIKEWGGDLSL